MDFWKLYRSSVKCFIQRFRCSDTFYFKKRFIEGISNNKNRITLVNTSFLFHVSNSCFCFCSLQITEYKYQYFDHTEPRPDFKMFIDWATAFSSNTDGVNRDGLAERLLRSREDNERLSEDDLKVMKVFYDLAMPVLCNSDYKVLVPFDKVSNIVSISEETFAFLTLENSINRWIYTATKQQADLLEDESDITYTVPDLRYQKSVKKRRDGRETAGVWLDSGLQRFNNIAAMIVEDRQRRDQDEERLMALYIDEMQEMIPALKAKRKRKQDEEDKRNNRNKRRVEVVDLFSI